MNIFFSATKCVLDFVLFYWFSSQFFESRFKNPKYLVASTIIGLAISQYCINLIQNPKLNTVGALGCAIIINFFLLKGNRFARLLCAFAEIAFIVACEFIPISIYSLAAGYDIATLTKSTIANAGFNLIGTGIFSIVIISTKIIVENTLKKNKTLKINENISIIIVPILSILIIYYILDINQHFAPTNSAVTLQTICIYLGLLLMNIIVIVGDDNQKKRYQLQREIETLNQLELTNRIVINQQDQYIEELKGFEHDYKKQMEGIQRLISSEHIDSDIGYDIKEYANDMLQNIKCTYRFAFIQTIPLRSILSQTQLRCSNYGITLNMDIQYGNFSFIKFPDLYSIFENPIENAIFSCTKITGTDKEKNISIQILRKRNLAYFEIHNSKQHEIILKNGVIQTSHDDTKNHGLGILNMKRAIEKYNGYVNISYTENSFTVAITLPIVEISDEQNTISDKD